MRSQPTMLTGAVILPPLGMDVRPNNGKWTPTPKPVMERVLAVPADRPEAERWVTLRSIRICNSDAYVVAVVDGRNVVADWRSAVLTPDPDHARAAANRLYNRITKEED